MFQSSDTFTNVQTREGAECTFSKRNLRNMFQYFMNYIDKVDFFLFVAKRDISHITTMTLRCYVYNTMTFAVNATRTLLFNFITAHVLPRFTFGCNTFLKRKFVFNCNVDIFGKFTLLKLQLCPCFPYFCLIYYPSGDRMVRILRNQLFSLFLNLRA